MPSTLLSLLFVALTLERATAAPTQSNLSMVSRDQGNSTFPQWAIDACKNASGCEFKNGIPYFQKPSSKVSKGPAKDAVIPTNSTSIQSGLDGEKDDYYVVQLDDQLVGTGLCAPDEFLKILFERSECPIGSTLPGCGAIAEYSCGYNDAEVGYRKPDADPSQKNSPQVDKCSMLFEGSWWSDGPVTPGGASNSKYSDLMKQYAIDIYTASMSAPKGNTSQQLLFGGTPPFPPHTTFMVPQKLSITAMQGAGEGGDPRNNNNFGQLTVNIRCALPQQKIDCGIWPTLASTILGFIPDIGSLFSAAYSIANQQICQ